MGVEDTIILIQLFQEIINFDNLCQDKIKLSFCIIFGDVMDLMKVVVQMVHTGGVVGASHPWGRDVPLSFASGAGISVVMQFSSNMQVTSVPLFP